MSENNTIRICVHVEGITELTTAINGLIAVMGGTNASVATPTPEQMGAAVQGAVTQASVPTPAPVPVPQSAQVPMPVAQMSQVPAQEPVQTAPSPTPAPIPTSAVVQNYTRDQLAVAASGLINMGKQQRLLEILHGFGVQALTELPENLYSAFAGAIKVEGAVF